MQDSVGMKRSELSETQEWKKYSGSLVKVVYYTLIHKCKHQIISKILSIDYIERIILIISLKCNNDAFMSLHDVDVDGGASKVNEANTGNGNI